MDLLGIDIGSSSVKCALLRNGKVRGQIVHAKFDTRRAGVKVEVEPRAILKAVASAARQASSKAKQVDAIALSVMSPAWVAMDEEGDALTPIVTHQDRRSVEQAHLLEKKLGNNYLKIAGTRPFPGGISSTTWAWFLKHEPGRVRKADLIGHLNTFLHRQFTGARVVDPANASFMGVYSTIDLSGWSDELLAAVGGRRSQLPEIKEANEIGGTLTPQAARELGLTQGTPMVVGVVDGSAAMLAAGAKPGQLLNVCGSTDVLALCTNRPRPHERLLTRALGVEKLWVAVSTIAAAGSAIQWTKEQLFAEMDWKQFDAVMRKIGRRSSSAKGKHATSGVESSDCVRFDPYLAGDRMSIEQKQAAFTGLTLATTREQMLAAVLDALAQASAARLDLLKETGAPISRRVVVTGGAGRMNAVLHRDWPGTWTFHPENEATLRGLAKLEPVYI